MSTADDAGLLTGSEVAALFGVNRGTVSNWGTAGRARELGLAARARLLQGAGR